jgi:hypothetical protein
MSLCQNIIQFKDKIFLCFGFYELDVKDPLCRFNYHYRKLLCDVLSVTKTTLAGGNNGLIGPNPQSLEFSGRSTDLSALY